MYTMCKHHELACKRHSNRKITPRERYCAGLIVLHLVSDNGDASVPRWWEDMCMPFICVAYYVRAPEALSGKSVPRLLL